jgi:2-dehydropantoate 2-reductase
VAERDGARVLVVGAGAIGGVTAARLARAGTDVMVLDTNHEHVRLMRSPGLRYDEPDASSLVRLDAVESVAQLHGRFDYALVTLKAPYLEPALTPLVEDDVVQTYVCLGNGLVQETVEELVGAERLLVGTVEWGATNLGPGHLRQTTVAPFVLGEPDGSRSERLQRLADILRDVAEVRVTDAIAGQVWSKLLLNSTFSGLAAVTGLLYRDIAADPVGQRLAWMLWTEGYDVARACGVEPTDVIGVDPASLVVRSEADVPTARAAVQALMARVGATKASMLQDLERGAVTEVDVINGGVVSSAERAGGTSPLNAWVVQFVHECERGDRMSARQALVALADVAGLRNA